MVARNNDDWDLCWFFQSRGGCRNSHCPWRHENPDAQLNPIFKLRKGYNGSYDRKSEKKQGRPFDATTQCQNGGLENQYDRVLDAEIDNILNIKNNIKLLKRFPWEQESENIPRRSTRMSRSLSANSCAQSSTAISRIISLGGSAESDIVKKVEFVTPRAMSKVQKRNMFVFSQDQFEELQTPQKPVSGITSFLSPFAKVFSPSAKLLSSTSNRRTFEGTASESTRMSRSLSAKSCAQSSIAISRIISLGGSDSESDIFEKVEFVTPRAMSKVQKRNMFVFSQDQFEELQTPQKPVSGITSSLSPFSKVFSPSAKLLSSTSNRRTFEGTPSEAKMNQSGDLVEEGCIVLNDKVWE